MSLRVSSSTNKYHIFVTGKHLVGSSGGGGSTGTVVRLAMFYCLKQIEMEVCAYRFIGKCFLIQHL